jgi:hypothetical protein
VLLALALLAARREASAGAALVAAAAVKLTGGLLLPFALLGSRRGTTRLVTAVAVTAAVVTALTLAVFGSHVFDTVAAIGTGRQFNADYSGPDVLGRLLGTGITTPVRIVCALGGGLVLAASLPTTLRGGDWLAAAGWTAFAAILIVPSFVPWYIAWLLPLSALARSRRLAATTVALTAAVALTHLPLLGFPSYVESADITLACCATARGRLKRTRVPVAASTSQIRPPCASTIAREIASPRPALPLLRAGCSPPWKNGSNTRSRSRAGMPTPLSATSTSS